MKHFRYIFASLLLLLPVLAHADGDNPPIYDDYKTGNGLALGKSVSSASANNVYTLTLETFATGAKSVVNIAKPADIVLVLDLSQSMTQTYNGGTRLGALQTALEDFLEVIYHNDNYKDKTNDNPREDPLGNRISIVTFAGPRNNTTVTQVRSGLTPVTNSDGTKNTSIISYVLGLNTGTSTTSGIDNRQHQGTYSDEGMSLANGVLNNIPEERKQKASRTVVLFTDGAPGQGPGWTTNGGRADERSPRTANRCISAAYTAKNTHTATVFTVILGEIANDDMRNYLAFTSSNYLTARALNNAGSLNPMVDPTDASTSFAKEAGADLSGVFTSIADISGGSETTIPAESMVVDAISSSFEVPDGYSASDVVVYYRTINSTGDDWIGSAEDTPFTTVILPNNYNLAALPPENIATQLEDDNTVGVYLNNGKLMIIGFNYSKDDGEGEDGTADHPYTGNWVGWREKTDGTKICAGKEVVIELKIEAIDGVTGGDHTNTNTADSGVQIPTYDKDGKFTGYVSASTYPYPDTDLPIRLVIEKEGLRSGESATIQIYRAPQKAGSYDAITGKPAPDLTKGWENFSKVILTNKGDDFEKVTKVLLSLDPKYVYRLVEDDWGWGYTLDTKSYDTSSKVSNPFPFTNKLKEDAVKHAEAVSINHFGELKKAETYKSSKTNYFTSEHQNE